MRKHAKIADKVYVMYKGEIVEAGVSFEIFENPGHVYTKQLLREAFRDLVQFLLRPL